MTHQIFSRRTFTSLLFTSIFILLFTSCAPKDEAELSNNKPVMILNSLENAEQYYDLHPAFEQAFAFLRKSDLAELSAGRHDIAGDSIFCLISKGPGKTHEEARLEAHRKFIDIQYIISGTDEMGWKPIADCSIQDEAYNAENDIVFFNDEPVRWTKVPAGSFTVFFPQDAHAPMVGDTEIHKVVMKIALKN